MSEWQSVALQEVCDELTVGHVGSMASEYVPNGVPFLRSQNVRRGRLDLSSVKYITSDFHKRLRKSQLRPNDIVIVRTGEPGAAALIPQNFMALNCSDLVIVRPSSRVDARFLCYAINTTARQYVTAHLVGAVQQHFNVDSARRLALRLPLLAEQNAIATVLGALDDKIAINDRLALAADDLVRLQYLSASLDCEETVRLGEVGILVRDTIDAETLTGDENYIGLEHMPRRNIWLRDWDSSAGVASAKSSFLAGDILFGKLRPYFHKVGVPFVNGICSTDILVVRPRDERYRGWLLATLASDDVVAHASAVGDGTRMPRAKWGDLANYEVPWIGADRARAFCELVASLTDRVRAAVMENRVLAELRDTLLPKLMSGEIRVRDAERIVEDTT